MSASTQQLDRPDRCLWAAGGNEHYVAYHDHEWGVPLHDDQKLFELLILEGAQAGLSWSTILNKRDGYRQAFCNFDPRRVAALGKRDIERLLVNPAIVRNRLKVESTVVNAQKFLEVQREFGSFDHYVWAFVDGKPCQNAWKTAAQVPVSTQQSDTLSRDLKKRGFKFVGTTIVYAFMQAAGMVNDHTTDCFRWAELQCK